MTLGGELCSIRACLAPPGSDMGKPRQAAESGVQQPHGASVSSQWVTATLHNVAPEAKPESCAAPAHHPASLEPITVRPRLQRCRHYGRRAEIALGRTQAHQELTVHVAEHTVTVELDDGGHRTFRRTTTHPVRNRKAQQPRARGAGVRARVCRSRGPPRGAPGRQPRPASGGRPGSR